MAQPSPALPRWRVLSRAVLVGALAAAGVSLAAGTSAAVPVTPADGGTILNAGVPGAVDGRYIVVFKQQLRLSAAAVDSTARTLAATHGGQVRHVYRGMLDGFSTTMTGRNARALAGNPSVAYVEQVQRIRVADTQNNPPNWGDDRVDQRDLPLNNAFTYPSNPGQGVRVYVLDTGINPNHVDFTGRVIQGRDIVDNDNDPGDCHGHGTHVAGTAVGTTFGIAKRASVSAIRVLDCGGGGTNDDLLAGMNWVRDNGVRPAVANYSIGCFAPCSSPSLDSAVSSIVSSGIQFVMAAGNSAQNACGFSPQKVAAAITVGNSSISDARNTSSNFGSCLDLFAPGTNVVSATHNNNTGSISFSGTSMASPHVAGAVAMYLGLNPGASSQQARDAIVTNGTPGKISNPGTGSPNILLYTGFMNGGGPGPGPVSVANPGNQSSTVGSPVSLSSSASGGTPPYTWSASGLPNGLSISSGSGQITGTPSTAGTFSVTLTATDTASRSGSTSFTWTVSPTGGPGGCRVTNDTDTQIPDLSTVESTIVISGCAGTGSATSTVAVDIIHPYVGDLRLDLVAPDGSTYLLRNRTGGSADNINQTFTVNLSGETANGTWRLRVQDAGPQDVGHINSWTLNLGGGGTPPGCTGTNGTDVFIPDNATVTSTIPITGCTGNASATSTVSVSIVHTYIGDLIVSLVAPDGTSYVLHNRAGGSADNINQTYTVNLSTEIRNGNWVLRVQDVEANDVGRIDTWTVNL